MVSLFKGDYFKHNLFYVTNYDAIFILVCDILSRIILFPYEIPVSVIVRIIGSALFIYLLLRGELS
ncbi:iron chelate uptake ABC transporter family permease subunit [Fundicoccus sp. Sow4_H7]|uniref:iron chelate uptake ABC transporter family permease subunit n=1 Tax=Fundicoccus sp. Sow4_H7 TaxID=3438784 RepID=UPI003F8EB6F1